MHPAFSVIFFTTSSGAGYGLLALMGLFGAAGQLPQDRWFGLTGLFIALGLVSAGLLASMLHLGRPERAWRAMSQWRSSWLAREGVLALATYVPAGIFAIGWVFLENTSGLFALMGVLSTVMALLTVIATSMIYRSLKTIHQWNNCWTLPGYVTLSLMTGALLLSALLMVFGEQVRAVHGLVPVAIVVAWIVKYVYWRFIDTTQSLATPNSAIGVDGASVKPLDPPHSTENYLLKEMGFQVARKHATKLRLISIATLFVLPLVLSLIAYMGVGGMIALIAAVLAVMLAGLGILAERWLFFAEARHAVNLYYGAESV